MKHLIKEHPDLIAKFPNQSLDEVMNAVKNLNGGDSTIIKSLTKTLEEILTNEPIAYKCADKGMTFVFKFLDESKNSKLMQLTISCSPWNFGHRNVI